MKFEIEDNLIVIDTGEGFTELVRLQDIEQILQAVKKTQTKLVNKQIQELQDSKNMTILQPKFEISGDGVVLEGDNISIYQTDTNEDAHLNIKCVLNHENVEQNQKIVDAFIELHDVKLRSPELNHLRDNHDIPLLDTELKKIQSWLNFIVKEAIGKDIKDIKS